MNKSADINPRFSVLLILILIQVDSCRADVIEQRWKTLLRIALPTLIIVGAVIVIGILVWRRCCRKPTATSDSLIKVAKDMKRERLDKKNRKGTSTEMLAPLQDTKEV